MATEKMYLLIMEKNWEWKVLDNLFRHYSIWRTRTACSLTLVYHIKINWTES